VIFLADAAFVASAVTGLGVGGALAAGEEVNVGTLAQYGVLGIFAAILVVFAKTAYRRETDRADRLETEVQRLNALIQDRVIGVITSATNAVEESTELMTVMAREQIAAGHRDRMSSGRREERAPR
jgi:hypothetical protein